MMKKIVIISLFMSFLSAWSQVGIGTHYPDPSAVLEVRSHSKGVLLPKHVFEVFDDKKNPIVDPQIGTLVYNVMEGLHSDKASMKGLYVWDGSKWNQLLNDEGIDRMTTIRMMGGRIDEYQETLIPENNINGFNYITLKQDKTEIVSSSTVGSVTMDFAEGSNGYHDVFVVPKGYYKVEVSIDGWNHPNTDVLGPDYIPFIDYGREGGEHLSVGLYVKECSITDINGNNLVKPKTLTVVSRDSRSRSIQGYTYTFFLNIKEEYKEVKIPFNHAEGSTYRKAFRVNQNGVSIKFRRYFD